MAADGAGTIGQAPSVAAGARNVWAAAEFGDVDTLQELIAENSKNATIDDGKGVTPLHLAGTPCVLCARVRVSVVAGVCVVVVTDVPRLPVSEWRPCCSSGAAPSPRCISVEPGCRERLECAAPGLIWWPCRR